MATKTCEFPKSNKDQIPTTFKVSIQILNTIKQQPNPKKPFNYIQKTLNIARNSRKLPIFIITQNTIKAIVTTFPPISQKYWFVPEPRFTIFLKL